MSKQVGVILSDEEYDAVQAAAKEKSLAVGSFCRMIIMEEVKIKPSQEAS
jgi:hypothetical protein